jgi:hypothetical protein
MFCEIGRLRTPPSVATALDPRPGTPVGTLANGLVPFATCGVRAATAAGQIQSGETTSRIWTMEVRFRTADTHRPDDVVPIGRSQRRQSARFR